MVKPSKLYKLIYLDIDLCKFYAFKSDRNVSQNQL